MKRPRTDDPCDSTTFDAQMLMRAVPALTAPLAAEHVKRNRLRALSTALVQTRRPDCIPVAKGLALLTLWADSKDALAATLAAGVPHNRTEGTTAIASIVSARDDAPSMNGIHRNMTRLRAHAHDLSASLYGGATPASKKATKTLGSFPMLTQDQLKTVATNLGWNSYDQSRMNTRYLAQAQSVTLSWGKKQTQTIVYGGSSGVANLDTGAFAALSVGADAFSAFESAVVGQVKALQADTRNKQYDLQPCTSSLQQQLCGGNGNQSPAPGCFMVTVPTKGSAKAQESAATTAAEFLLEAFPTMTIAFASDVAGGPPVQATVTTAMASVKCDNTQVFACSYPTASSNGIPTPLWLGNPFFNDRFVSFDRGSNSVTISAQGVNACTGGFEAN